jgi:hypothetical protein
MMRWISAVAVLLLAGCSAVPTVPAHVQTQRAAIHYSGGPFKMTDSGQFTLRGCAPPDGNGRFLFSGSGSGSFIHSENETGSMNGDVFLGCEWTGTATLVSSAHPRNTITMRLFLRGFGDGTGTPCRPPFLFHVQFTVLSGTGKFAGAMGSGTVAFSCGNGTYTDQWSGTITF